MYNPIFDNSQYTNPNQYQTTPYSDIQGAYRPEPQPMQGNMTESQLYPYANAPTYAGTPQNNFGYAHGGRVSQSNLPSLAEMIRREGNNEDTILAHINPIEAMMLKRMGGSGTINPRTGLPQFSFWKKPWKATRSSLGSIGGTIIGNAILPGIGGVIGGALGQGTQHASRGKNFGEGALKGAAIGSMLPSAASLAGMGANSLGATGMGSALSNYGAQNSVLASLGMKGLGESLGFSGATAGAPMKEYALNNLTNNVVLPNAGGVVQGTASAASPSFLSQLGTNSASFFSKPKNWATIAAVAGSMAGRKKEKTPEQLAAEKKRYERALLLTAEERAAKEADTLANRQMERRIALNQYLPEEKFAVNPIYRRAGTPEEFKQTGKWLSYYNHPAFMGQPLMMKQGGRAQHPDIEIEEFEMEYPSGEGYLLHGHTGGQDDKIRNPVNEGDFILPADVVSHAGDGNTIAGGKNLDILFKAIKGKAERPASPIDAFLSDGEYVIRRDKVTAIGKGDNAAGSKKLDAFMKNIRKSKGASPSLPPKIKSLASYITR